MRFDVVCTGPVFLDLTFEGLDELPAPGRECFALELHETPGGAAITAIGLARLGLRVAVAAPLASDVAGTTVSRLLEAEGVTCVGATSVRTPVTAVLPLDGDRAFVTYDPSASVEPALVERLRPRAVVVGLDQLQLIPDDALAYVVVGDREAELYAGALPPDLCRAQVLLANRSEAERLTGERDAAAAASVLAQQVPVAVVSCGGVGAVAASDGNVFDCPAPPVEVRDTTGAGDLLAAAYVWADLEGLPLVERLRRAVVYSALSVQTATGAAGAATYDELERARAELDPAIMQTASAKEGA
ncbi:MAG: carbohydrate kinase family protein [Gaiellaceae bacterium]